MDHIPLNRPRTDDGDLNDEVKKGLRFGSSQTCHLCGGFYLERAKRVGLADHLVGPRAFGRDSGQVQIKALLLAQKIKGTFQAAENAKP